jgi:predicted membrane protein
MKKKHIKAIGLTLATILVLGFVIWLIFKFSSQSIFVLLGLLFALFVYRIYDFFMEEAEG